MEKQKLLTRLMAKVKKKNIPEKLCRKYEQAIAAKKVVQQSN